MTRSLNNFLDGFSSVLNLFPVETTMRLPSRPSRTDAEALRGDWEKIGGDFKAAVIKTVGEHGTAKQTEPGPTPDGSSR